MPVCVLPVVEADTGMVSKGSMGTQEVVCQDKGVLQDRVVLQVIIQAVLQGVHRDRQDRRELRGVQEALGLETVEVLQTGCQEGQGCREAWVHVEGSHLGPKVGVNEVVEGRSLCWGLRQVVRGWVVEKPLREEVRS